MGLVCESKYMGISWQIFGYSHQTNWQSLHFALHQKKRRVHYLQKQIEHLKTAPIHSYSIGQIRTPIRISQ